MSDLFFFVPVQVFLACKTEEFDFDMDGEKAPICYKEITTALRQWILPTFVSSLDILIQISVVEELVKQNVAEIREYTLVCCWL